MIIRPRLKAKTAGLTAVVATVVAPTAVSAHMMFNSDEFYGGAAHPWINLESSLLLITACLWLVQWNRLGDPRPLIAFSTALISGTAVGALLHLPLPPPVLGYSLVMLAGLLVAGKLKIRRNASVSIVFVLCFYAGMTAGADAAVDVKSPLLFLSGVSIGAVLVPLIIAGMLVDRKSSLVIVGIRIVGSWVAAIGLMLLAFSLRKTLHGG